MGDDYSHVHTLKRTAFHLASDENTNEPRRNNLQSAGGKKSPLGRRKIDPNQRAYATPALPSRRDENPAKAGGQDGMFERTIRLKRVAAISSKAPAGRCALRWSGCGNTALYHRCHFDRPMEKSIIEGSSIGLRRYFSSCVPMKRRGGLCNSRFTSTTGIIRSMSITIRRCYGCCAMKLI